MSAEQVRKNNAFVKRFRRTGRLTMPDYIAEQKSEGRILEHEPTKPRRGSGKSESARSRIARRVQFSRDLESVSTNRQLRASALIVADRIIAQQRRTNKIAEINARLQGRWQNIETLSAGTLPN